jgi:HTH-type transcriptional regulator/antitoxin HigA
MNIYPVNSEQAYDEAVERIETLWGAESGTPEGNELDVLLTLVSVYEKEKHPVPPPTPIEAINFIMEQKGMKQADMVPYIGSRSKVSEVLRGKRKLSISMIRSLHTHLNIPADILITEEMSFPPDGEGVKWDSFPVKEIVAREWVTGFDPDTQAEEIMRDLASQSSADAYFTAHNHACLRQGTRRNAKDDPCSIDAWILGVLAHAEMIKPAVNFSQNTLDKSFISKVVSLSGLKDGPLKAQEFLENKGIRLVIVPHFKRTYLDGAVLINKRGEPIIALSVRHDRLDNFWFTLAHELAHLVLGHVHSVDGQCIIDDLDLKESPDAIEKEADELAMESLIPGDLWSSHPARETMKLNSALDLAQKADVHLAIVAGRIRYESGNYRVLSRSIGQGKVKKLFYG